MQINQCLKGLLGFSIPDQDQTLLTELLDIPVTAQSTKYPKPSRESLLFYQLAKGNKWTHR